MEVCHVVRWILQLSCCVTFAFGLDRWLFFCDGFHFEFHSEPNSIDPFSLFPKTLVTSGNETVIE
jgi:hypothetical protein